MDNEKYEISIICCYYNEINILNKKFENFLHERKKFNFSNEIIIADNNSTDGTIDFLRELDNRNIKNLKICITTCGNLKKGDKVKERWISSAAFGKIYKINKFPEEQELIEDLKEILRLYQT